MQEPRHRPFDRGTDRCAAGLLVALALACAAVARGDTAVLLDTEWKAAVERARLVLGARETVDVSTFILGDEPFSLTSMALLRDAARRGVRVRLLVDAQWNKLPTPVEATCSTRGSRSAATTRSAGTARAGSPGGCTTSCWWSTASR